MQGNRLLDFLLFRSMITPLIIQVIYLVGVILSVIFGVVLLVVGVTGGGGGEVLVGLCLLLVAPVVIRIWCELSILFFRMHQTLIHIHNLLLRDSKNDQTHV